MDDSSLRAHVLPARLVEITQDSQHADRLHLRLVVPTSKETQYTCLSHVWGSRKFIQTQKISLPAFLEDIPWHALPQTFRDAIRFTYYLGIGHIWIDSLCICQDDTEDWRQEGSKMDFIYSGARLTLAASRSTSAEEGLFVDNPSIASRKMQWASGKATWDVFVRESFKHATFDSGDMPLMRRAWVYQERLLSKRVVHFTSTELLWECMNETRCECSSLPGLVPPFVQKAILSRLHIDYWHQMISEYSQKDLTYERDIFPALQGIAKRVGHHRKGTYFAGLWQKTLRKDLLWYTATSKRSRRPQKWRAPSWSWASVIGGVSWLADQSAVGIRPSFSVISVTTAPAGEDEFGELTRGVLRLKGRCSQGSLTFHTHTDDRGFSHNAACISLGQDLVNSQEYSLICDLDYNMPFPEQESLAAQPIDTYNGSTSHSSRWAETCTRQCRMRNRSMLVHGHEEITVMRVAHNPNWTEDIYLALRCVNKTRQIYERFGIAFTRHSEHGDYLELDEKIISIL
jgi:hypothetical protein